MSTWKTYGLRRLPARDRPVAAETLRLAFRLRDTRVARLRTFLLVRRPGTYCLEGSDGRGIVRLRRIAPLQRAYLHTAHGIRPPDGAVFVSNLAVHPGVREPSHGLVLARAVLRAADDNGWVLVIRSRKGPSNRMRRVYKRVGFRELSRSDAYAGGWMVRVQ